MTEFLPERLLHAIGQREHRAHMVRNALEHYTTSAARPPMVDLSDSPFAITVYSKTVYDPSVELRHCEADRRTVRRHSRTIEIMHMGEVVDARCADCVQRWPCADLRDRAAAYGIEVGGDE